MNFIGSLAQDSSFLGVEGEKIDIEARASYVRTNTQRKEGGVFDYLL